MILNSRVKCEEQVLTIRDRKTLLGEEIDKIALEATIDVSYEQFAQLRIQLIHVVWIDGLLSHGFLDDCEFIVLIFYTFDGVAH